MSRRTRPLLTFILADVSERRLQRCGEWTQNISSCKWVTFTQVCCPFLELALFWSRYWYRNRHGQVALSTYLPYHIDDTRPGNQQLTDICDMTYLGVWTDPPNRALRATWLCGCAIGIVGGGVDRADSVCYSQPWVLQAWLHVVSCLYLYHTPPTFDVALREKWSFNSEDLA